MESSVVKTMLNCGDGGGGGACAVIGDASPTDALREAPSEEPVEDEYEALPPSWGCGADISAPGTGMGAVTEPKAALARGPVAFAAAA